MARPEFAATPKLRRQVAIAAGAGMSHEEIGIAIGCSRNTLEKHFEFELSEGALKRRLDVVQALHRAALKGNVAAAKLYLAGSPQPAVPPLPDEPVEEEKLGKKERADRDAKTAAEGTTWSEIIKPPGAALQ